ncbi:MAG: hypothetical protein WAW57_15195 [Lutibacter sp.]
MGTIKAVKNVKIELSIITDVLALTSKASDLFDAGKKLAGDAKNKFANSQQSYDAALKDVEKGISLSKELGNDPKWFLDKKAQITTFLKAALDNENKINSFS